MKNKYMEEAINLAKQAEKMQEVPVGAVVVKDGEIIGRGYNKRETDNDPTAHAEVLAIKEAAKRFGSWKLCDCDLYVTLEPCPMCAGAIINSRIKRVFFGAYDIKGGAASNESVTNLFELNFNHKPENYGGICEEECSELISNFFKETRKNDKK